MSKQRQDVVTRIACSSRLNTGKHAQLEEQARRLGQVRSRVWREYGSITGLHRSHMDVTGLWLGDRSCETFGVLANPWKETVRDAMADIRANREAAKEKARKAVWRRTDDEAERKRMFRALKDESWARDSYLRRVMRKHWKHGKNHVRNQIVVRSDNYTVRADGKTTWLAIPGLTRNQTVKIPLDTSVAPSGTLRVILRDGMAEVHYQVPAAGLRSSQRPCGTQAVGVDKGYTEVLTDSDGVRHGPELGKLLSAESDRLKLKNQRRQKLMAVAKKAAERGDHAKAARIAQHNLGTRKKNRQARRFKERVRTVTFKAVHDVADKANVIAAEDLTHVIHGRKKLGKNTNRRLAAWTKGVTAEALKSISERRGPVLRLVNAAYTSQVNPDDGTFGNRQNDWLYCENGDVWQADHAAAVNVLQRISDPDITLYTPHARVKKILQDRIASGHTAGLGLQHGKETD